MKWPRDEATKGGASVTSKRHRQDRGPMANHWASAPHAVPRDQEFLISQGALIHIRNTRNIGNRSPLGI